MRLNLTHNTVAGLKPPPRGQADYWDTRTPGFGVRVSTGGAKTYVMMYRANGRKRRMVIGRFPVMGLADARDKARKYLGQVAAGEDPGAEKQAQRQGETFAELAALYLERWAAEHKKASSASEDKRMLEADLAAWNERKLETIGRADVIALLDRIVARGASIQANRTRALISKLFNFAIARGLVEHNPASHIPRPTAERTRDRVLSADEIRVLWLAAEHERPKVAALFKLALLTAARRTEILGMRWDEIDIASGWWTIPRERSKNGLAHRIPLVPCAVEVLRGLQLTSDDEFVFPGGRLERPVMNPQKWLRRIREVTGIANFRLHDLRRTVASNLTALGVPRLTVSKLLNHAEAGVTAVYDRHSYDGEKRAALLRWETRLREIVSGRSASAQVIALRA
jgi:integrase